MKYCRFSVILCVAIVFGTGGLAAASEATTAPAVQSSGALGCPPACTGPVSHSPFVRIPTVGTDVEPTQSAVARPSRHVTHAYVTRPMHIGSGASAEMTGVSQGALRYQVRPSSSACMLSDIVREAYALPKATNAKKPSCSRDLNRPPTSRWSRTWRPQSQRSASRPARHTTYVRSAYWVRSTPSRVYVRAPAPATTVHASCDLTVPPTRQAASKPASRAVEYPACAPCLYTWRCGAWRCNHCGRVWRPWSVRR